MLLFCCYNVVLFCCFVCFDLCSISWSDSELDSDIEDAIYARIYFDENEEGTKS